MPELPTPGHTGLVHGGSTGLSRNEHSAALENWQAKYDQCVFGLRRKDVDKSPVGADHWAPDSIRIGGLGWRRLEFRWWRF